jgi:tellurite methyltransferase
MATRSPWALEYARRPDEYVLGTAPTPFARMLCSMLVPGARVLELGCGEGRDSVFFASYGCAVTAVDVSAAGLRKAERLARRAGVEVHWVHSDAARYLPRGRFDFVYSCGAIHYVPRRLRPGLLERLKAATSRSGVHAHLVFTDRTVYIERNERIDYFLAGELGRCYADWLIWWNGRGTIACDVDGRPHRHGVEELVARPPER